MNFSQRAPQFGDNYTMHNYYLYQGISPKFIDYFVQYLINQNVNHLDPKFVYLIYTQAQFYAARQISFNYFENRPGFIKITFVYPQSGKSMVQLYEICSKEIKTIESNFSTHLDDEALTADELNFIANSKN